MEKGVPIRAISRGIAVLGAINRHGSLSMMQIARYSAVPYPTACRILQTLLHEGLVEREPARKRYRPTILVRTLSSGFQESDHLVGSARDLIVDLGKHAGWPVALCTRVGVSMMVRDSTHALSALTFQNYYPGYTLPILSCASGKAYLAFCSSEERELVLEALEKHREEGDVDGVSLKLAREGSVFEGVRENGFASQGRNKFNATPGKTSSIAVPVYERDRLVASLAMTFFASAITIPEAAAKHLPSLLQTAAEISRRLTQIAAQTDQGVSIAFEKSA